MPDGRSVEQQVQDNAQRLQQVRRRMKKFGETMPASGAWSVDADYGAALPPKNNF
jgi:hypothetical protein